MTTRFTSKTFKREVALGLVLTLIGFGIASLFVPGALDVVKVFVIPFMSFTGLSFGLDSWSKQIK